MDQPSQAGTARLAELRELLAQASVRDRDRLRVALERLARKRERDRHAAELQRLEAQLRASVAWVEARRTSVPAIRYDETLPVQLRRDEIAAAIRAHQVVIVSGAT